MADKPPLDFEFDTAAARADGVADADIASFLAGRVGFDLAAARQDGVSDAAIVDFLAPERTAAAPVPESRGTWGSDLKAGFSGTSQAMAGTVAVRAAQEIEDLKKQIETFKQDEPDLPEQLRHLAPQRQRQVPLLEKRLADAEKRYASALAEQAQDARALKELPVNEPMQRFVGGDLGEVLKNPGAVARGLIGQSATAMVPLIVGVALGGPVGGAIAGGATGVATGGGQEAVRILSERGIDARDAEAVKRALDNPEIRTEIDRAFGIGQAIEGTVGAATGALGGVTVPGRTVTGTVAKNVALQAVGQGAISGAGEAAKQGVIEGEMQPGKIAAAALSEALFAPADVAAGAYHGRRAAAQRPRTPEAAAEPVLRAETVDDAIAVAREAVDLPALDETAVQAAEFGNRAEQDQAAVLRLFGGLNDGEVQRAADGAWFYRKDDGKEFQLQPWDGVQREDTIAPALAEAQRAHYEQQGVRVVYFENDAAIPFDGAVDPAQPNTIFLSNNPDRNAAQVGAHEITHVFESTTLPDGTNLGDLLQQQVAAGITAEGRAYAERLFGPTAPKREAFPEGEEGASLHADAVTAHLFRELGADIGGEAPKFQTFIPRVIDAVEARYGTATAKDVMQKLIAGIRQAMTTLRQFFFRADEGAEYGQPPTESQQWVSNLEQIHGTLAQMYAQRFGATAGLAEQAQPVAQPPPTPVQPAAAVAPQQPPPVAAAPAAPAPQPVPAPTQLSREQAAVRAMVKPPPKPIPAAPRQVDENAAPAAEVVQSAPKAAETVPVPVEEKAAPAAKVTEQVAEARETTNTEPTDGQKEAGNYLKGRVSFHGLPFVMENPKGSTRSGVDGDGKRWEATLPADYGYLSRTEGADGDQVDAYIGPRADSQRVWVIDQIDPKTGKFDEHKVMLGTRSVTEARMIYQRAFSDRTGPQRVGAITEMSLDQFKAWLRDGDTKSPVGKIEPKAEPAPVEKEKAKVADMRKKAQAERPAAETPLQKEQARVAAMKKGAAESGQDRPELAKSSQSKQAAEPTPKVEAAEEVKPAPKAAPAAPTKPETPPAKASPSRMIEDAGEKIGGARKDLWAERGMRLSDLEGMTEGEAYQHVTKDAVWPKPDYAKMVEGGMSPEAAALVKIIRDRLSARPSKDSPEGRQAFVKMMGFVREAYAGVKTKADFRAARDRLFYDLAGWPRDRSSLSTAKEARDVVFSVYKGRQEPFRVTYADERKAQQMVEQGFPAKGEPWTRRYEVRQWGADTFAVVSKGNRRTVDSERFSTREAAEAHAKATYDKAQESGQEAPLPTRPHLDSIERTGIDVRSGRDVTGIDFVQDFGFRGVEFGNWVASDERQKVVNLAYDALHDMAGVLGVPVKALSLDGQLGLAFGARGSGRAAAHYEPGRLVINMTKLSGAGSLAHEWGHALDHHFGTLDTPQGTRGAPRGASGWYDRTEQRASYLKNLRPEMAEAFDNLMTAIFKREKPKAEAVRDTELRIERYQSDIAKMKERMAASKDTSFEKAAQRYIEQTQLQLQSAGKRLADLRDEEKPYTGQKINSSYYDEANKLSGKSGEKGYWSRPTEMFARAFESYVFDKIKEQGGESQYLVQGVEPERYASGYKGNPYPAAERPTINAAFDRLFETMDVREGAKGPVLFSPRVDTPEFKRWFGESKVVDENGEPLVVFHGTNRIFSVFRERESRRAGPYGPEKVSSPAFFFTPDRDTARMFAEDRSLIDQRLLGNKRGRPAARPFFLKVEQPLDFGDGAYPDPEASAELARTQGREVGPDTWQDVHRALDDRETVEGLKDAGYDGVRLREDDGAESWAVFDPRQIKSTNNRGTFDPASPNVTFSPKPFYSALTRGVEALKMEKAPPGQWEATIRNMPGVKAEERAWVGLDDWLRQQPKSVTKAEVLDFLRANEVQVQEVQKGGAVPAAAVERLKKWADDTYGETEHAESASELDFEGLARGDQDAIVGLESWGAPDELMRPVYDAIGQGATKYGGYTLPGGENYRELLLTLPERKSATGPRSIAAMNESQMRDLIMFNDRNAEVDGMSRGALREMIAEQGLTDQDVIDFYGRGMKVDSDTNYRGSHWDEPNVLAHIRFDDRTGPNGEKVLHVAEIQSDWHQEGRKKGYQKAPLKPEDLRLEGIEPGTETAEQPKYWFVLPEDRPQPISGRPTIPGWGRTEAEARAEAIASFNTTAKATGGVPEAPFKTTWPELAMKRVIRYAAENGYDRISWDTGATNATRYDLSKQVDGIDVNPRTDARTGERTRAVSIHLANRGGTIDLGIDKSGVVDNSRNRADLEGKSLSDIVGKEVADKIMAVEGSDTIEGQDLKIGGEGMVAFYDKQLPLIANKLGKKFGAKVEETAIRTDDAESDQPYTDPAHSLPITDAMRKAVVEQGQPLFSPRITGRNTTRDYTPEQIEAFERIGRIRKDRSWEEIYRDITTDLGRKIIRNVLDPYVGLKARDPEGYLAARTANSNLGAIKMFNTWGTLKFDKNGYVTGDQTGGVIDIIDRLGPEAHDFISWVAGNRAERLKAEDRENLFSDQDIATYKGLNQGTLDFDYKLRSGKTTRSREAAYLDALGDYEVMRKNLLELAVESGLLGKEAANTLWENPFYVPFYRVAETDNSRGFVGADSVSGFVRQTAGKRLKGGTEKLAADLWGNFFGNASHMIDASIRNRAANRILDRAVADGVAEPISLKKYTYEMTDAEKADTVWTMRDGKRVYFRINDDYLLKSITALDFVQTSGLLMQIGRGAKRVLQIGVAASPVFQVRNLERDTVQAMAVSPISKNVFKNFAQGVAQQDVLNGLNNVRRAILNQDMQQPTISRATADAIAGGATMRFASGVEPTLSAADTYLDSETKIGRFLQYFGRAGQASAEAMAFTENVNRLALYQQLREQGEGADLAAFEARDLADFTLVGASPIVRHLVELVPYMNAWMQGLYKVGRTAAAADESVAAAVGGKVARQATKKLAVAIVGLTALDLALNAIYEDDEDFKAREEYDRNANFWFKAGGLEWRIPRPFEIGALSKLASIWTEALYSTDMTAARAWKNTREIFLTNMAMNPTPQAIKPLIDLYGNETRTGRPIETMGMERLRPEFRTSPNTSLVARGVSDVTNRAARGLFGDGARSFSPVQLDYLIQAYAGWMGTSAVQIADAAVRTLGGGPDVEKPDRDMVGKLTGGLVTADRTSERGSTFYTNMLYEQGKQIQQAYNSYRDLVKRGRIEEAREYLDDNRDQIAKNRIYQRVIRTEGQLNEQIRAVTNSPTLSGEQKRVRIMALQAQKNRAARALFTPEARP